MSVVVPVLTIDGPAGAGKGTIAAAVAGSLNWYLLDSGAIYRAAAEAALREAIALDDVPALLRIIANMQLHFENGRVWHDNRDVTVAIRTPECSEATSCIAAHGEVRSALIEQQRAFRRKPGLVADGRDMGTVVFPDATCKVFLTASPRVRAERRLKQLSNQGISASLADLERDISMRDERDSQRSVAPLRPAKDAIVIDSSEMTPDEVLAFILRKL
ncbi:MAG: cytidylate kinase [Proteobacteria bacterium]|nr:MAG: cytidylate kinase [Pseudomonadota bacterium]